MNSTKDYTKIKSQTERLALKNRDLHRVVTHENYSAEIVEKIPEGEKGCLKKILFAKVSRSDSPSKSNILTPYEERYREDDAYWEMPTDTYGAPKTYGGASLLVVIMGTVLHLLGLDEIKDFALFIYIIALFLSVLFLAYYFFMPKDKEHILDRMQGTITFPGIFWEPNYTMPFKHIKLFIPGGGTNAISAPGLNLIIPKKYRPAFFFNIGSTKSYDNMTLLTWYMDKNRPLPPLRRLKPYMEKDFERRKAEGFPPPLYPAFFHTNEANQINKQSVINIGGKK